MRTITSFLRQYPNVSMYRKLMLLLILNVFLSSSLFSAMHDLSPSDMLPTGFVHLIDIDSTIIQSVRYASSHNFLSHPVVGYHSPTIILTNATANALASVQTAMQCRAIRSSYTMAIDRNSLSIHSSIGVSISTIKRQNHYTIQRSTRQTSSIWVMLQGSRDIVEAVRWIYR